MMSRYCLSFFNTVSAQKIVFDTYWTSSKYFVNQMDWWWSPLVAWWLVSLILALNQGAGVTITKRENKRIALRTQAEMKDHPVALCVPLSYVESRSCSSYQFYFHIVNKLLSHSLEVIHLCTKARELLLIFFILLSTQKDNSER